MLVVLEAPSRGSGLGFALAIGGALLVLWAAALALLRALRRFFPSRWPYLWRQGVANLYRPANQTVMVVLALGFGAFLLDTLFLVQHNLLRDLRVDGGPDRPNLVLFDIQPDQRAGVEAELRKAGLPVRQPGGPPPRGELGPLRAQLLRRVPAGTARGRAAELRDLEPCRRPAGAGERPTAHRRVVPQRDHRRPRAGAAGAGPDRLQGGAR